MKDLIEMVPFAKTRFSMMVPEVEDQLRLSRDFKVVDTVVLLGIEAHVCVNATCIDLIHRGYNVNYFLVFSL